MAAGAVAKFNSRWALLAKLEASYRAGGSVSTSTDGIMCPEAPTVVPGYAHDGSRQGKAPGTGGSLKRVARSGRFAEVTIPHEFAGAGAAYSASVFPSMHALLRASRFDAAVDVTGSAEKWTYTPSAFGSWASLLAEINTRGENSVLKGLLLRMRVGGELGNIPRAEFTGMGVMASPATDQALPSVDYAAAGKSQDKTPAKAVQTNITIGNFAPARVKDFELEQVVTIDPLAIDNTTGEHGGFTYGVEQQFFLRMLVEATAQTGSPFHAAAALDPHRLADAATAVAIAMTIGSAQYSRWKISAANAQLVDDPWQDESSAAHWNLRFQLMPSAVTANDELSLVAD